MKEWRAARQQPGSPDFAARRLVAEAAERRYQCVAEGVLRAGHVVRVCEER